jgi:hypothetical protein
MAPDFLPEIEYPKKPFGMFFVIGKFCEERCLKVLDVRQATTLEDSTSGLKMSLAAE